MEVTQPRSLIRRLLRIIEECGGVVDVVFLAVEPGTDPASVLHRGAAVLALEALQEKLEREAQEAARRSVQAGGMPWNAFSMTLNPCYMPRGRRISVSEFLHGPEGRTWGFVHAFCDPPYPMSGDPERLLRLFTRLVLHDLPPGSEIWQWDPEGSNYFDAGKDGWGSFFWTVRVPPGRIIIALLASATD